MPRWLKIILRVIAGLVAVVLLLLIASTLYITFNKAKVLRLVNTELNKNLDGTVTIGDMRPEFFKGFPHISLALENVLVRDRRFAEHHHTLLNASDLSISVNAAALLRGTININHVDISNATIDLYTDGTGYSNTSVFKKGASKSKDSRSSSGSAAELDKFKLTNVAFSVNDQRAKKLFSFVVNDLQGNLAYPDSGWRAQFHLDVFAKSMAFSTLNGSFIKDKNLEGDFVAGFNQQNGNISVMSDELDIGEVPFRVNTLFATKKAGFDIHVAADAITWQQASALLAKNVKVPLKQFNIANPIAVTAKIAGNFNGGDTYLYITAAVRNNTVITPWATLTNCSFNGVFTNGYDKNKPLSDENSVIRFVNLTGTSYHIPINIDTGSIINLSKPIATGNLRASFPVADLNYLPGNKLVKFGNGTTDINLRYKTDIVNFQLNKPVVLGAINLKNADIDYLPANLSLKNTSLSLNFVGNDLVLKNIRLQSGKSVVMMDGRVNNFLNLYYSAPEKILLTWQVHSPQLYLAEFLGFLGGAPNNTPVKVKSNSNNAMDQMTNVLQKGRAELHIDAANVHYNQFLATDAHADIVTSPDGVTIKSFGAKHAGGALSIIGNVKKSGTVNKVQLNTMVTNVDVREFFLAFNNFGLHDFTYQNLKGILSAKTDITAGIDNKAALVPGSLNGTLSINLKNGALINFKPLLGVGRFAFPFRDLKNIFIPNLDATFNIHDNMVTINPMQISSSVLNIDVAGVYGLTNGTNIALDVPLRNPKGDSTIMDKADLDKKRYKGIVLHILAKADETGKIKFGLNKNHKAP